MNAHTSVAVVAAAILGFTTGCGGEIPFGEDLSPGSESGAAQAVTLDDEVVKIVSSSIAEAAAPGVATGADTNSAVQVSSSEQDTSEGNVLETTYTLRGQPSDPSQPFDAGSVTIRRRTILIPSSPHPDTTNDGTSGGGDNTAGSDNAPTEADGIPSVPYEAVLPDVSFVPTLPLLEGSPSDELYVSFDRYRRIVPEVGEVTISGEVRCIRRLREDTVVYVCAPDSTGGGDLTVDAPQRTVAGGE